MASPGWPPPESLPARGTVAELLVRVFGQRPASDALLVAHLDPAQIHHRIDHRDLDPLALAGAIALAQRREEAGRSARRCRSRRSARR